MLSSVVSGLRGIGARAKGACYAAPPPGVQGELPQFLLLCQLPCIGLLRYPSCMNNPRLPILSLCLFSLYLILPAVDSLHGQSVRPRVGEPFPVQLFPQIGEKRVQSLARFIGKKVLLIQFASW